MLNVETMLRTHDLPSLRQTQLALHYRGSFKHGKLYIWFLYVILSHNV